MIAKAVLAGCRPKVYADGSEADFGLRRVARSHVLPGARGSARDRRAARRLPPLSVALALGLARGLERRDALLCPQRVPDHDAGPARGGRARCAALARVLRAAALPDRAGLRRQPRAVRRRRGRGRDRRWAPRLLLPGRAVVPVAVP